MKLSSLEEKYNKSRKLGYLSRTRDSLYPSFSENRTTNLKNSKNNQSFENAHLSNFTSKGYEKPLRAKYSVDYELRKHKNETFSRDKGYQKDIRSPIKQYRGTATENINRYRYVYDSPIKSLPIPMTTPTKIKPRNLYKVLDTTPNVGSISRNSKKKNKIYKSKNQNSRENGIFSKLRSYLNRFNLSNLESSDSNLKDLKISARKVLDIPVDSKKIEKKVSFEDVNIDDNNHGYRKNTKPKVEMNNFNSNLDLVDDIIKEDKSRDIDVALKLREQLDDLQEKHNAKIGSLNEIIYSLREEYKRAIEENKAKEIRLEEQFDVNYKNIIAKHQEKQSELDRRGKELERERLILKKKEAEIESKLEKLNAFSISKLIKKNSALNKQFYENEYSELLQNRLAIRLKIDQNLTDYSRICNKLNIRLPLDFSRRPNPKYQLIIEKFQEYSKLLELPEFYKTMNLREIEILFNKLKQNLVSSCFKKKSKSELLEEEILKVVIKYERSLCSVYDVSRVFSRKNNILQDLDLIYNLLIDLNSLFSQLNELIALEELNIDNFTRPSAISHF